MKRILFFDDEPFITNYLIKSLQEVYGWKGDKEINYVSTVDKLLYEIIHDAKTYDLFVLDVMAPVPDVGDKGFLSKEEKNKMMDGMSTGLVLADKIRKKKEKVPVLFLTARVIPPIPESESKYTKLIRKPVSPQEISNTMNELLKFSNTDSL